MFPLTKAFLVEIGGAGDFEKLKELAKQHGGRYFNNWSSGPSFFFFKEDGAKAFQKATEEWPRFAKQC